jgi:hypothetical protein
MKTLLSALASTFRQFTILLKSQKGACLGGLAGYLFGLSCLGPSAPLHSKLTHLSMSANIMFMMFMVYAALKIRRQSKIFKERFDLEDHLFQIARRQGDYNKAQVHLDRMNLFVEDLISGEYLKWK